MHVYATNLHGRHKLAFWLAVAAITIASGIGWITSRIEDWIGITAGSASSMGIFLLLWWWLDNRLWKHPWVRRILLVPDLNGVWHCDGRTLKKGTESVDWPWSAEITIRQSWTKMLVRLGRDQSSSASVSASLYHEGDGQFRLIYYYDNTPKASEQEHLRRHTGLANLLFDQSAETAAGSYFTDGDRFTVGEMTLKRNGVTDGHQSTT